MGLYEVPLSMTLLGLGMGTMLANFHICGIMFLRNVCPTGSMFVGCLMFSMSRCCELLFLLCFITSWI